MAIYGLQTNYMNKILKTYFGLEKPILEKHQQAIKEKINRLIYVLSVQNVI